MKRNVAILIFKDAEVLDFTGPFEVFSVASNLYDDQLFNVFTVAKNDGPVHAVNGLSVHPHYSIAEHPKIDILIVSGGVGTKSVLEDAELLDWIAAVHQTTEMTVSICSGSRLLGRLGLLDGKPFCTHHQVYDHMEMIAPLAIPMKEKRFIQSGKIFTSGGISAGIDLSFHVVETLCGQKVADATAAYMEYNRQPQHA
ncbi:DJ-1/PfpI family protein [Flavobacterium sp.]|uniref:DJ-1/PfpI family protein n=1 Tax=Flavobacterium sp. TaxID=239 RepID=UPI0039E65EED